MLHMLCSAIYMLCRAGEMSATIMRYTGQWSSLVPAIKSIIGNKYADVKVGIGLNFNALGDTETHPPQNTGLMGFFLGSGQRAPRYPVPGIDGSGVNDLISHKIDFVGISAYAPFNGADFGLSEFENSAFNVADSLRGLANVNLAGLVNSGKVELHYSEFGVGGGQNGNAQVGSCGCVVLRGLLLCHHLQQRCSAGGPKSF
jgi:hypothetical protein